MKTWKIDLKVDPLLTLSSSKNKAILHFIKRDLLDEEVKSNKLLWKLPEVGKILKKQNSDGSWKYPSSKKDLRTQENYNQLETYRQLGFLVEKYALSNLHPSIRNASDYLFSFQTKEGDFRGIYGTQYSPNYSAGIMELLIKSGYDKDPRIEKGLKWLLSIRQDDGGWAVPLRTNDTKFLEVMDKEEILQPDRKKPFSHLITGVVLRAFAVHPKYRNIIAVKKAGELLASRFFEADKYSDRKSADYWFRVSFPFWWTDIVSALDTLYKLDFSISHPQIKMALNILKER